MHVSEEYYDNQPYINPDEINNDFELSSIIDEDRIPPKLKNVEPKVLNKVKNVLNETYERAAKRVRNKEINVMPNIRKQRVNKNQPINTNLSNYQIPKKSITNHNKTINNEETLNYLSSNNINKDFLYNLTTPSPSETPQITPNKKIYINENFYETLEGNRIKKNFERTNRKNK